MSATATRADVARLFGRAAFGATKKDLDTWTGQPYEAAVDSLFPPGPPGTVGRLPELDEGEGAYQDYQTSDVTWPYRWWLERMRTTPYPLEERVTLFWHDHFATAAIGSPDPGTVMIQNKTLRLHSLGSFRALANAITIDGAMVLWLSGIANVVGGVNENYAREFLELFTLGKVPQVYTETDVREAAKAFTGFTFNTVTRTSQFVPTNHDTSVKHVLGRTIGGHLPASPEEAAEYSEVTEAALAHDGGRTSSRYVAYKLVQQFGYEVTGLASSDPVVEDVAAALRANDAWDIKAAVRTMLLHPGWREADPARRLVRSPVDVIVHAAKVLGFPNPSGWGSELWPVAIQGEMIERTLQVPLLPPNVGGWPHGLDWLSQVTTLARYDVIYTIVRYFHNAGLSFVNVLPPSGDIAAWAPYMGLDGFTTSTALRLQEYLDDPGTTDEIQKQIGMFVLVSTSPDWQVI
jgi:uncharacterized protein (DUF1800 family)